MNSRRPLLAALLTAAAAVAVAPLNVRADDGMRNAAMRSPSASKPVTSGTIAANGLSYHYQVHGEGEPLLLLHGGLGQIESFGPVLGALAARRQVIGVDLHGHGRTALGDRPIRYRDIADDLAVVLKQLGHERADVMGYSMGGAVALRLAAQHPQRVRRLVIAAAPYDWADDVKELAMPVMLVYGDADMVRPEHIVKFYQLLGGGLRDAGWQREHMSRNRLAILPDLTHYEGFSSPALAATALRFLDTRIVAVPASPATGTSK